MLDETYLAKLYPMKLPIADNFTFWNGKPDKWNNIGYGLSMSQRFGMKMCDYSQFGMIGHNGVDIAGVKNTPIVAPIKMWISFVDKNTNGYGNTVYAETETIRENGESYKLQLVFGHFNKISAKACKWVDQGEIIGEMGTTGFSTGNHLHFGIRPLTTKNDGTWTQMFFGNGYLGYINPEVFLPYMNWDIRDLINLDIIMEKYEKKILIEGEGVGRKGIVINGKLREITKDREAAACLYALVNNGLGKTISTKDFDITEKDENF